MRHETKCEMYSLAGFVGAAATDLLSLARLVAGDEPLVSIDELTEAGAHELMANLRIYGRVEHGHDWMESLVA